MKTNEILGGASAVAAGGIPDELEKGIIQVVVGIVVFALTNLFDRWKARKKKL
jgi:hypothetical protein